MVDVRIELTTSTMSRWHSPTELIDRIINAPIILDMAFIVNTPRLFETAIICATVSLFSEPYSEKTSKLTINSLLKQKKQQVLNLKLKMKVKLLQISSGAWMK